MNAKFDMTYICQYLQRIARTTLPATIITDLTNVFATKARVVTLTHKRILKYILKVNPKKAMKEMGELNVET